jgi:hypothetical protein
MTNIQSAEVKISKSIKHCAKMDGIKHNEIQRKLAIYSVETKMREYGD